MLKFLDLSSAVLQELAIELDDEREFTDKWARDCPKNYQAMLEEKSTEITGIWVKLERPKTRPGPSKGSLLE